MLLTSTEQQQLVEHIKHWESKTDAEFVVVIAQRADFYRHVPLLIASAFAFLAPWVILASNFWLSTFDVVILQAIIFVIIALIGYIPPIHRSLTPKKLKRTYAARLAKAQFVENNLYRTRQGSGVLIFISEFEHYIEILSDYGISEKVDTTYWNALIEQLRAEIKRGKASAGIMKLVDNLGGVLSEHFPATDYPNELPNNIITL